MRILKPRGSIKPQAQISTPTVSDDTLVDDTVALVDDPTALVGGKVVTLSATRSRVKDYIPKVNIRIRR